MPFAHVPTLDELYNALNQPSDTTFSTSFGAVRLFYFMQCIRWIQYCQAQDKIFTIDEYTAVGRS
jgi:hypothetical protein